MILFETNAIRYQFRNAAISAVAVIVSGCLMSACGPDKEAEALRQENAALRREAADRESVYGKNTPLSDSARAAAGISAGTNTTTVAKNPGADAQVTQQDINDANRLGLPVYPNAILSRHPGAPDHSVLTGGGVNIVLLESTDKLGPIVAYYTDKMAASNADQNIPGSKKPPSRVDRVQDKFRVVNLTDLQPGGGIRTVKVHEDIGKCYIELMNIAGNNQIPGSVLPPGSTIPSKTNKPAGSEKSTTSNGASSPGVAPTPPSSQSSPASTKQQENDPLNPPPLLPSGRQ